MSEIKRNGHGAMDMTQGSPTRLIVLFSLPLLAGNVRQQVYNMVGSGVGGNYVRHPPPSPPWARASLSCS